MAILQIFMSKPICNSGHVTTVSVSDSLICKTYYTFLPILILADYILTNC